MPAASMPAASPSSSSTAPSTSDGPWSYAGCFTDTVTPRTLPQWSNFNGPNVSNDACMSFCDSRGFPVAGTEYAGQCFCGAEISSPQLSEDQCNMACTGDASQTCGGPGALTVYTKGAGSAGSWKNKRHMHGGARHGKTLSQI
jgi:hypothetical protein